MLLTLKSVHQLIFIWYDTSAIMIFVINFNYLFALPGVLLDYVESHLMVLVSHRSRYTERPLSHELGPRAKPFQSHSGFRGLERTEKLLLENFPKVQSPTVVPVKKKIYYVHVYLLRFLSAGNAWSISTRGLTILTKPRVNKVIIIMN